MTTAEHCDAVSQSRADRDQSVTAMDALERALAAPAPGREQDWSKDVLSALKHLESALRDENLTSHSSDGLFHDIQQMDPRLEYRVSQLCLQLDDIRRHAEALRGQLESTGDTPDFADIRQRLAWLLTALRHYHARETDLIYEAYQLDIGQGD